MQDRSAWVMLVRFRGQCGAGVKASGFLACFLALLLITAGCVSPIPRDYAAREGDLVFQSLPHVPLVDAIEGVTHSRISHCGIVAKAGEGWVVIEAMGSVKETSLGAWIDQGRDLTFVVCRLNDSFSDAMPEIIKAARSYLGRPYDAHYSFDDKRIYCSELIYKAIKKATGKSVGEIKKLGDLDWKPYEQFIRSMEGGKLPLERTMVTPIDLMQAPELTVAYARR